MIQFHLITGFLGSGKTTLLSNLLKELAPVHKVAVIQNEFAPTGIDGKELKQNAGGFKLVEINNGSVFCVCQLGSFHQNMQKMIQDYMPEHIFLEASGLADPISIVELLQSDDLKSKVTLGQVISLVDAPNFFKGLNCVTRFKHQLMIADTIIVNKTDLIDSQIISEIKAEVEALNPFAQIRPSVYANVDWRSCIGGDAKGQAAQRFIGKASEGRPNMHTSVLRTHDKISLNQLNQFIKAIHKQCIRIKGFMNLTDGKVVSIHSVYDVFEIKVLDNYAGPSELIVFSESISLTQLRQCFKQYQQN
ncbi:GTP-binding protein [Carboxylicivirga sp. RSCT41]|uniref:GTP-binding protein n=1 Tax=Carboxylicivirga agarovorans TaxID=3417570 RepID=UPI003D339E51